MNKTAEWWINECGGVLCSSCGLFHDDYIDPVIPDTCERCGSKMSINKEMYVSNEYRLSSAHSCRYIDESEYPDWLLKLRKEYLA